MRYWLLKWLLLFYICGERSDYSLRSLTLFEYFVRPACHTIHSPVCKIQGKLAWKINVNFVQSLRPVPVTTPTCTNNVHQNCYFQLQLI